MDIGTECYPEMTNGKAQTPKLPSGAGSLLRSEPRGNLFTDRRIQRVEHQAKLAAGGIKLVEQRQDQRHGRLLDLKLSVQFNDQPYAGDVDFGEVQLATKVFRTHPILVEPLPQFCLGQAGDGLAYGPNSPHDAASATLGLTPIIRRGSSGLRS